MDIKTVIAPTHPNHYRHLKKQEANNFLVINTKLPNWLLNKLVDGDKDFEHSQRVVHQWDADCFVSYMEMRIWLNDGNHYDSDPDSVFQHIFGDVPLFIDRAYCNNQNCQLIFPHDIDAKSYNNAVLYDIWAEIQRANNLIV